MESNFDGTEGFRLQGGIKDASLIRRLGEDSGVPLPIVDVVSAVHRFIYSWTRAELSCCLSHHSGTSTSHQRQSQWRRSVGLEQFGRRCKDQCGYEAFREEGKQKASRFVGLA